MERPQSLGDKVQDGNGINDGLRVELCLCRTLLDASETQRLTLCKNE